MILDTWNNKSIYANIHPLFPAAFEYINKLLKNPVQPGTYEIQGESLFAKVQEYKTRTEGYLEVHDAYIDIQYIVDGIECVEYAFRDGLMPATPYNAKEDVLFLMDRAETTGFPLTAGSFAIFFPEDAHKPAMCIDMPKTVKKVVVKVKI